MRTIWLWLSINFLVPTFLSIPLILHLILFWFYKLHPITFSLFSSSWKSPVSFKPYKDQYQMATIFQGLGGAVVATALTNSFDSNKLLFPSS
jgi:hypothetical protein